MSAKKAPKSASTSADATGAPKAASKGAASKATASKTNARAVPKGRGKSAPAPEGASKPLRTRSKAASKSPVPAPDVVPEPLEVPRKAVPRKAVQRTSQNSPQQSSRSGKRSGQVTDELDEPLIAPSNVRSLDARSALPGSQPANPSNEADAEAPMLSPGLWRGFARVVLLVGVGVLLAVLVQNRGAWWSALTAAAGLTEPVAATPVATTGAEAGTPSASAALTPTVDVSNRVGIISGHRGNDSGAVCPDGLTEAQVNFDAATRVASILRAQGYTVDVLDEFDTRLKDYRARALLSIHADSCAEINELATGYKVARTYMSAIPDEEDKLVACVSEHYKAATGLRFHHNTVTHDMLQYHAFREVDKNTPSAIIELGFLNLDRELLTRKKDTVAKGVSEGLLCYLRGETP